MAEGGEGSHATPSDADEPRGRETIRSKEDTAHTVDTLCCSRPAPVFRIAINSQMKMLYAFDILSGVG